MVEIFVEVRPVPGASGDLAQQSGLPELLSNRIDEIGDGLRDIAARISHRLEDFAAAAKADWHLGEVELKFSLDLEAEAGVIIARTSARAGFEATLKWRTKASESP